jgi:DHA1 family bicyclomycin/chloramphenicol resistance-like MFS transporter
LVSTIGPDGLRHAVCIFCSLADPRTIVHAAKVKIDRALLTLPTASRALPNRITLIVLLGALSAFGPLSMDTYLPALPELQAEFGASTALAQLTLSACLLGLATGQLVAGSLSDRHGRHWPLLGGLATYAVASLLCAVAPSIWVLLIARYVQGAAGGAGVVIARATVRDLHEGTEAARFFSRLMLVSGLAPILAPILGGQLLRVVDWRGIFVFLALTGVALLIAAALLLPETLVEERKQTGGLGQTLSAFRVLLTDRVFAGYALTMGCAGAALFGYIASSPFVLQEIYGLSEQAFSLTFGSIAIGYIASSQINGRLVGRVALPILLHRGLVAFAICGALLLAAVLLDLPLALVLLPLYLMMWTMGFVFPNSTALALTNYPHAAGSAAALLGLSQFALGAVAAPLAGIAGEDSAVPMAVVIAAASSGALLGFRMLSRRQAAH